MKFIALVALLLRCAFAAQWTIGVGKDEITGKKGVGFDPSAIHPAVGDDIVFEFRSGAHSVVQSTFDNPCVPLDGGYNSGVFNVDDSLAVDASGLPTTSLKVNGTDPIWFFDQAGGQCQSGGVFAVNAPFSQPAPSFVANAEKGSSSTATATTATTTAGSGESSTATATTPGGGGSSAASSSSSTANTAATTTATTGTGTSTSGGAASSNSNSASHPMHVNSVHVAGLGAALAFLVGF